MKHTVLRRMSAALITCGILSTAAQSGELLYNPINPAFGGNPNFADYLLNSAQLQNQHIPEVSSGGAQAAPEINFPPITIDLGGAVAGATQNASDDVGMTVGNGQLTASPATQ